MDEASFHHAIRSDPDDDALRRAYADWLEANGQVARAEWIRVSCDLARLRQSDEQWMPAIHREIAAFRACRPVWWEDLSNITQRNDRGMFRFVVGDSRSNRSPTPVKRLGKAAFIGLAFAEGWLQRIELLWDDGDLGKVVAAWKGPAALVPLFARPAPQIDDEGLRQLLRLPQLEGLGLESHVLRNAVVRELASYQNLQDLSVELRLVDDDTVDAVLSQIAALPRLRRLRLEGHERLEDGTRPNDADLVQLRDVTSLKRLNLSGSPAVTDAGIEDLRRARPTLIVERT